MSSTWTAPNASNENPKFQGTQNQDTKAVTALLAWQSGFQQLPRIQTERGAPTANTTN